MNEKTPIGYIHNVPIYGRLPERFINTLTKIEAVTTKDDWNGLTYLATCDMELELSPDNPNIAGGSYLYNDLPFEVDVTYEDGTVETFAVPGESSPVIFLESGLFKSEYWFACTLFHELGHHNDPLKRIEPSKEVEIFAHKFALDRLNIVQFDYLDETPPTYYHEAKADWDIENGY
jgi:hypothetical protein